MAERLHLARSHTLRTVDHQPRQQTLQARYSGRGVHCLYVDHRRRIANDDPGFRVRAAQPQQNQSGKGARDTRGGLGTTLREPRAK